MAKAHKKITITNTKAQTLAAILSGAISPDATEAMDNESKSKGLYRLGKTHGNLTRALEPLSEAVKRVNEEFTLLDDDGNKVEVEEGGYKVTDPEAYAQALRDLGSEEVDVEVSIIPLSWLNGNTNLGGLASVCPDMITEDE